MGQRAPTSSGHRQPSVAVAVAVIAAVLASTADAAGRVKRQLPPIEQGNQVIDDIFQIPISTLNAVGSLIKSARPLVRRTRERIQQYYTGQQQQRPSYQQQQRPYPSAAQQQQYSQQYSQSSSSSYGIRPYYNAYVNGNRIRQQRDDPPPQGRRQPQSSGRRPFDDDY